LVRGFSSLAMKIVVHNKTLNACVLNPDIISYEPDDQFGEI